mmetsp:Transcript_60748/g.109459  ORF Transcript_60748/g.109459 Transcript_60748/m.109459 type:complete len:210 (+) Transcript_60748:238-867(+)
MDSHKGEVMLIVHHMASELIASISEREVWAEEQRLLLEEAGCRSTMLEEPRPILATWKLLVTHLLNSDTCALIGDAWVGVAVEHDSSLELRRNGPVKVDHARSTRLRRSVACRVVAGVAPALRRPRPRRLRRRRLDVERLANIISLHIRSRHVVERTFSSVGSHCCRSEERQVVDPRLGPLLREATGCCGQKATCRSFAARVLRLCLEW